MKNHHTIFVYGSNYPFQDLTDKQVKDWTGIDTEFGYTLVQHSGFGYGGDRTFQRGLEPREITSKVELNRVRKVGGLVLQNYIISEDMAEELMYPNNYPNGAAPTATYFGNFSVKTVDDLHIFVPKQTMLEEIYRIASNLQITAIPFLI